MLNVRPSDWERLDTYEIHDNGGHPYRCVVDKVENRIAIYERQYVYNVSRPSATVIRIEENGGTTELPPRVRNIPEEEARHQHEVQNLLERGFVLLETDDMGTVYEAHWKTFGYKEIHIGVSIDEPKLSGNTILFKPEVNDRGQMVLYANLKAKKRLVLPTDTMMASPRAFIHIERTVSLMEVAENETVYCLVSEIGNNDVPYPYIVGEQYTYLVAEERRCLTKQLQLKTLFGMFGKRGLVYDAYYNRQEDEEDQTEEYKKIDWLPMGGVFMDLHQFEQQVRAVEKPKEETSPIPAAAERRRDEYESADM